MTQNDGPRKNDEGVGVGGPGNSKGSLWDFDFPKGPLGFHECIGFFQGVVKSNVVHDMLPH
jgi:hypothetical protein